jgi:murein L,D-transpeptidase YcbB/YkuD
MYSVRQSPGPHNMMGQVKFMLPNALGVYLHDTPIRAPFAQDQRNVSHGCVRLQDAVALARWLLGPTRAQRATASGLPNQWVTLPAPIPVYITYLTAAPGPDGVAFREDAYGRDPPLIEEVEQRLRRTADSDA